MLHYGLAKIAVRYYNMVNKIDSSIPGRVSFVEFTGICLLCVQARGIDVQQVSLVINYDLPTNRENYIHR